ncbi:MAG: hypothetical protein U0R80_06290 [Nocardioidaceae bacterium]
MGSRVRALGGSAGSSRLRGAWRLCVGLLVGAGSVGAVMRYQLLPLVALLAVLSLFAGVWAFAFARSSGREPLPVLRTTFVAFILPVAFIGLMSLPYAWWWMGAAVLAGLTSPWVLRALRAIRPMRPFRRPRRPRAAPRQASIDEQFDEIVSGLLDDEPPAPDAR